LTINRYFRDESATDNDTVAANERQDNIVSIASASASSRFPNVDDIVDRLTDSTDISRKSELRFY
jgi:hypothetical protein